VGSAAIHGELLKLGIDVGQTTVAKDLDTHQHISVYLFVTDEVEKVLDSIGH
jgi:hypothetical protein